MKMRTVTLTTSEISSILAQGGILTFTPLRGNRLKCNQAPHLTRLSNKQAESLRAQVAGYRKNTAKNTSQRHMHKDTAMSKAKPQHPLVRVWLDGNALCPACKRWRYRIHFRIDQPTTCPYCQSIFIPVPRY